MPNNIKHDERALTVIISEELHKRIMDIREITGIPAKKLINLGIRYQVKKTETQIHLFTEEE